MRAVIAPDPGGLEALVVTDLPDLTPGPGEVVVTVSGTAVNRADPLQRQGKYPPPQGAPAWLGLECTGAIVDVGVGVTAGSWATKSARCSPAAVTPNASSSTRDSSCRSPPESIVTAAALPEVASTVWSNVFGRRPPAGEPLLMHGGGSGIGTFAIQLANARGARVITTASSQARVCESLGADVTINYREQDF